MQKGNSPSLISDQEKNTVSNLMHLFFAYSFKPYLRANLYSNSRASIIVSIVPIDIIVTNLEKVGNDANTICGDFPKGTQQNNGDKFISGYF